MSSLQQAYNKQQPTYSYVNIAMSQKSDKKFETFILVEGRWDCVLYRKVLNVNIQNVGIAEQDGKSGFHYVESIVDQIAKEFPHSKVYGIRDRDYTDYDKKYKKPRKVFLTDEHSLEMMLLHSNKVREYLSQEFEVFEEEYPKVLSNAKEIAEYYIYNVLEKLNIDFSGNKLHLINFIDSSSGRLVDKWQLKAQRKFRNLSPKRITVTEIHNRLKRANFYNADDYQVCRGHDVIDVLYSSIQHGSTEKDQLMGMMVNNYSEADFNKTKLSRSINHFLNK